MDSQANEQAVRRSMDAFNAQRWDDYAATLASDAVIEYPQSGERFVGAESCVAQVRAAPSAPQFQINRLYSDGNLVVAEADEVYDTGERWQAVVIYEFKDGKIVHEIGYWSKPFPVPEWRKRFVSG